ncbi:MAG: ATP-dependent 6-phosphofructokinase [Deltaproteobacteria bacterium]|nr:ATP-dependent 6-phosphofructokinase [Deltaproteobacteria bacterium]
MARGPGPHRRAAGATVRVMRRFGLLTGGGDCPGLNAVIWSVVRGAAQAGVEIVGVVDGFEGLVGGENGLNIRTLGSSDVRNIFNQGGTVLGTTNRGNPFKYATVRDGQSAVEDRGDEVVANIARLGLEGLIAIGGDGSLAIAHELAERGARVIGVPKTIDNDLGSTDTTFGFYTAVEVAMDALDRLRTTGESHDRVMILEVMGRYAGWIALHAGLVGGAHVVLMPEIPYDLKVVMGRIRQRWHEERRNFTLIVVAEGAFPAGGQTSLLEAAGAGKVARLGGAAHQLEAALREAFAQNWDRPSVPEVRTTVLGHIQRGGSPCAYDRLISLRFGAEAVRLALAGQWGRMVCLRGTQIESVPLVDGIRKPHMVETSSQLVRHARSVGICLGD